MKQLLARLANAGFNSVLLTLQKIQHANGTTWAYSTMTPRVNATLFGRTDINATISIIDPSKPRSATSGSSLWVTSWLNDCDDDMASEYRKAYGDQCIAIVATDADGTYSATLHTADEIETLLASEDTDVADVAVHAS